MQTHLSGLAAGSPQTDISANIHQMGRCFEQGVPADDDTCVRMMRALPKNAVVELGISAEFYVDLSFLQAGMARDEDEDDEDGPNPYPECDA